jgi:transposase
MLIDSNYEFIIGASHTFKEIKHLTLKAKKDIENANNLLRIEDKIIFYRDARMVLDGKELSLYVYYDIEREKYEKERFYIELENRIEKLRNRKVWKYEKPEEIAREIMGEYYIYIRWVYKESFNVWPKNNAIAQRINRCGITILGYKGNYKPDETLIWYRERDSIEKMFLSLKSYLGAKPIRVQSIESLNGLLFINFIALILRHKLLKMMYDSKLSKKYSVEKLMLELSKIRKIVLANGKEVTSEITKKQREIMESLNISADYVPKNPRI